MTPQQTAAQNAVHRAVASGAMVRPEHCDRCGRTQDAKLDAHHPDYSKPLSVEWLCHPCHRAEHAKKLVRKDRTVNIGVRVPLGVRRQIKEEAVDRGLSVEELVRVAISEFTGISFPHTAKPGRPRYE